MADAIICLKWDVLLSQTFPEWLATALADMDAVLLDHAHCEKKAAASAMSLVAGYPTHEELVRKMSALAIEELQHFRAVYERLVERGLSLGRDSGDPYAQKLIALARPREGRLTDRLLIFGFIEARSHERLVLLAENLKAPELARLYTELKSAESRHSKLFVDLACRYDDDDTVKRRITELAQAEAEIVASLPVEPRIH